jgi:transposase
MIQAIEDINAIIKELAVIRLKAEGGVDGRVAKSIANRIAQASGERLLKLELAITERDRALAEKDAVIAGKDAVIAEKDAVIDSDKKRIAELEKELARYKEYCGKAAPQATSLNSSLPPSKNPLSVPRTQSLRKPSGRKPGGQVGHEGHTIEFSGHPDSREACPIPHVCPICGEPLDPMKIEVCERRQVIDLPLPVVTTVREYIQHCLTCDKCGHEVKGIFPDDVKATVCYGENIQALVAYLSTLQAIPMKRMTDFLENICGIRMSPGTVSNILDSMRKKARKPYEEIRKMIEHSEVAGGDETGIHVNGSNEWMWTFQTAVVTYLAAHKGRGSKEINATFPGGLPATILVTDRLKAYFNMNVKDHQICLAHLLRNTVFFEQLLPKSDWPKRMLELLRESIHLRKTEYTTREDEENFKRRLDSLIDESVEIEGEESRKLFDTFRKALAKHREHIFLFLSHHNVPYDNNGSERAVRPVKTKLKVSGQFRSDDGAKNYATLMSIALTAKKNNQNPFFAFQKLAAYYGD